MKLNMQIILDHFDGCAFEVSSAGEMEEAVLIGPRVFSPEAELLPSYVYVARAQDLTPELEQSGIYMLIAGTPPACYMDGKNAVIRASCDFNTAVNEVQSVFERHNLWDKALQDALNNDSGVDELCRISLNFFNNPIFVHDPDFYIITCPVHYPSMTQWESDTRTGKSMVPLSVINQFKLDFEYLHTLTTHGAQMFSADMRGYRILYMNIWNNDRYEGRICIDEVLTKIKPGHFLALENLCEKIQISFRRHNLHAGVFSREFERFLCALLDRSITDDSIIEKRLELKSWHKSDDYICIAMGFEQRDFTVKTAIHTCNDIETRLPGSYAFLYEQSIFIIINLTFGKTTRDASLSNLSYILREGLFKAGVSNTFNNFGQVPYYYTQANIALELGRQSNSTTWYYKFENYALLYLYKRGGTELPANVVCCDILLKLREYDKQHSTSLYGTLKKYLFCSKNAVKTAKELYIHRSTLFYRLDRIVELTGITFDDTYQAVYLLLSYMILDDWQSERYSGST